MKCNMPISEYRVLQGISKSHQRRSRKVCVKFTFINFESGNKALQVVKALTQSCKGQRIFSGTKHGKSNLLFLPSLKTIPLLLLKAEKRPFFSMNKRRINLWLLWQKVHTLDGVRPLSYDIVMV